MVLPQEVERAIEREASTNWDCSFTAKRVDNTVKPKEVKGWRAQKFQTYNQYMAKKLGGKDAAKTDQRKIKAKI